MKTGLQKGFLRAGLFIFSLCLALFIKIPNSYAGIVTWGGGGTTNNWSEAANWVGGALPGSGDTAKFDSTSTKDATIDSSFAGSVNGVNIALGYTGTVTLSRSLTIGGGGFTQAAGTFTAGSNSIDITGPWDHAAGTFNQNTSTVTFTGASNQSNADSQTFYNLVINKTDNWLVDIGGGTWTVTNALTLTDGRVQDGTIDAQGTVSINAAYDGGSSGSGTLKFSSSSATTITLPVLTNTAKVYNAINMTGSGVTLNTSGSGTLKLGGSLTISGGTAVNISNLMNLTGAYNQSANLTTTFSDNLGGTILFSSTFTLSSGTVNFGTNTTVEIDGNYSQSGGTLTATNVTTLDLNGTVDITNAGATFTAPSPGTVTISGRLNHTAGTLTVGSGTFTFDGATNQSNLTSETFYNLTINKTDAWIVDIASGTSFTVTNTLTLTDGKVKTGTLIAQGNVVVASTLDAPTAVLQFTGSTATQTFDLTGATSTWATSITINKASGTVKLLSALVMSAASQNLTLTSGTLDLNGNNLTVNGTSATLTVQNGAKLQLQGGETITANTNYPQLDSGSTVTYNGTSSYTVKNYSYHHLTLNGSGGTFTLGAAGSVAGNLTITAGTLDLAGQNLSVTGTFSNSGTLRLQGGETTVSLTMDTTHGTVIYNGSSTYTSLKLGNTYQNVTFNNSSGTWKHSGTLTVNGNLTITAGTLDSNSQNITLTGNWSNSGTYTSGTNTVTLNGTSQTISGSATFSSLTKTVTSADTLTIAASTTQTIAGTLTLQGASGQNLSLRSGTTSTQWNINPQSTISVSYLDVKDSNDSGSTVINCWTGCTNSTGNTNWSFAQPSVAWTASSQSSSAESGTLTVTAQLSAASGVATTVPFTVTGTATGSGTDYSITASPLTINAGSTTASATITITSDTLYEGNETVILTMGSPTNASQGATTVHTATITDDDSAPTVAWTTSSQSSSGESGTMTVTAQLSATSGLTTTVPFTVTGTATGSGTDYSITASPLTINAGSTTASATITITSDTLYEGNETVILTIGSPTNATQGATTVHTATITDDDPAPTVAWTASAQTVAESAGTATITAQLSAASAVTTTIPFTMSGTATGSGTDYSITSSPITIAAGLTSATITVTVIDDALNEASETVIVTMGSPTNASQGATTVHTVTITDNDTAPSISFTSSAQTVAESAGTVTLTAQLSAVSGQDVQAVFTQTGTATGNGTDYGISSSPLTIAAGSTSTTISITLIDDSIAEDSETIIVTMSSPTNATLGSTTVHTVTITDNDTAGVTVTESGGSTNVTEGSTATDSYTVVLQSQPTATVTITPSPDSQVTVSPATLTFTASNWNTAQTVTVTAFDDSVAEGNHTGTITHSASSSDSRYNGSGVTIASVTVNLTDNDSAGVSVTESGGATTVAEGGATDTYTIVLTTQPTANVTIAVSADSAITTSVSSITFTASNWNTAQTVTVTAVNNSKQDGTHTGTITHTATSTDTHYSGLAVNRVTVTVSDNDVAGITVTQSDGSTAVTEGGATDTYTIVLTSQPTATVTITISPNSQLTVSPTSTTFTDANWSTAQTITVTAVDDTTVEGAHSGTITHSVSSTDTNYSGLSVASITVAITDNDTQNTTKTSSGRDDGASDTTEVTYTGEVLESPLVFASRDGATNIYESTAGNGNRELVITGGASLGMGSYTGDYNVTLTSNNHLVLTLPESSNSRGTVYISSVAANKLSSSIDLDISSEKKSVNTDIAALETGTPAKSINLSQFTQISGSQAGSNMGKYIGVGDINNDGTDEVIIMAPGDGHYGVAYVYDSSATLISTIFGSKDKPLTSILVDSFVDTSISDLFFGPNNPAINASIHLHRHDPITSKDATSFGFLVAGQSNFTGNIDLATVSADATLARNSTLQSAAFGDVNHDGKRDLILVDMNGTAYIYFGDIAKNADLGVSQADVIITGGSSSDNFGLMTSTGDVSGDGIDDIIFGAPAYGDNLVGAVYVVLGRTIWPSTLSVSSGTGVQVITGTTANGRIGSDLLLADRDGDGQNEIYTTVGDNSVLRLNVSISTATSSSGTGYSVGNLDNAFGCTLVVADITSDKTRAYSLLRYWTAFIIFSIAASISASVLKRPIPKRRDP